MGRAVSPNAVVIKACEWVPELVSKTPRARYGIIMRFLKKHKLTLRTVTHVAQADPKTTLKESENWIRFIESENWIRFIVPRLIGTYRDKRFILNMDQTPVYFSMHEDTTIERVGARSVNVIKSKNGSQQVTVAVTVSADGQIWPPMIIYKAVPGARVEKELKKGDGYPTGVVTAVHKAWMAEPLMEQWVNDVLVPYVKTAPALCIPVLFLDAYRCHMMAPIVSKIQDLGIEVMHLPPGCTSLTQPNDVGINKPLKNRVKHEWDSWMIRTQMVETPRRPDVSHWVINALNSMPAEIVRNSWRKEGLSYFPNEDKE